MDMEWTRRLPIWAFVLCLAAVLCVALAVSVHLDGWHWPLLFPAAVIAACAFWSRHRALRDGGPDV